MKTRIRDSYTPKLGDYCNTLVIDKETGNQYLFDADGVWTLISTDEEGIVTEAVAQANAYTDDVAEGKVDKEEGKGLSENDFTDEDKGKLDDIEEGAQENVIEVVKRNGTALPITDKTVDIAVPTTTSSLTNDSGYITNAVDDLVNYYDKDETDTLIATEAETRDAADLNLQEQIDAISSASDVVDVVGTYAELQDYDTSRLGNNDIIKVLTDETHDNAISYYRWNDTTETFTYIGSQGLSYTKSETDATFVPQTRTINGKGLNSDVVLTAADVNALPASTVIPTVNDATLTIKKNGTTVATFTANSAQNVTADISVPTKVSDLANDLDFVEEADLADVAFSGDYSDLIGAPSTPTKTSDLTNDSDFVSDANYVHTDNNFTTALKNKLNGIAAGAEVNVQSDWNVTDTTSDAFIKNKPSIPAKTSDLTNDSGFITSGAVPTKTSDLTNDSGFITKSVSDLTNYYTETEINSMFNALPAVPTKTSDLTNDSGFLTTSTLPIATASRLGVVKIGSGINVATDGTISAAVASLDWANITNKPTNVSYWTNDAGYITSAALPTKTSDLTNDSGFITSASLPTKTSDLTNDSGFITSSVNNLTNYYTKSQTYTQGEVNSLLSAIVIPTKTSELTNDSNFITSADLPTIDSTLNTSSTNAVENQAIANAIDLKYDKTGGEITGNAKVDGTFTLDIEDPDYDAGINFTRTLDDNLGTTLTLAGYAGNTNYKTLLRNIATPNSDYDAANKKYVDDHILTPVNYLVALDQNGAIDLVSSSLNYATVKAYLTNNSKDVYLDVLWEPSRFYVKAVQDEDTNNGPVNFIGSYSRGGKFYTALFMLDSSDNLTVLHLEPQLAYEKAQAIDSTNISSTTEYPTTKAVADYVAAELTPTVIYSNATGLSPLQADVSASIAYQLTGLDLSPYKRIKVHIGSSGSSGTGFKSSGMIELSLDANLANASTGQWVGSVITENAADRNRLSAFLVAVSPDKTSFAYARATSLYGTAGTNISDAYVKLIEGFKY